MSVHPSLQNDSYAFVNYSASSYYPNPIDLSNLSAGLGLDCPTASFVVGGHPVAMALESSGGSSGGGHHSGLALNGPIQQHPSATASSISSATAATGGSDLDINVIKDRLMTTRVPESCV